MRYYVLAAVAAATVSAPAFAQTGAPFAGARVEGIVGYERPNTQSSAFDGVVYGVGAGYDFRMGGLVAGVEAEISDSTASECVSGIDVAGDETCFKIARDIYAGGRIGAAIGSSALVYAKAGYTNARFEIEYEDGLDVPGDDFEGSDSADGLRVGGGLELALGTSSFVKAEYRYSDYNNGYDKHQGVVGFGFRF